VERISQRDIRALKIGVVCAVAIAAFAFGTRWFDYWASVRESLRAERQQIERAGTWGHKEQALTSIVPVFEMPQEKEKQEILFRDKLSEQLKKAGIESEPLQSLAVGKSRRASGYRVLRVQCRKGKCNFGQILDLLGGLNGNPYLVGLEELEMRCKPDKRQEFELNFTASTFVK
jgi:hypothetical protein